MAATRRAAAALGALAACAALGAPSGARATDRVAAAFTLYADSDHVTVASPRIAGSIDVGPVTASVTATVDVVSAASVDLVTAASPGGFEEARVEATGAASYDFREGRTVSAHFGASREPDYFSFTAGGGASWDVLDRQATLGLEYSYTRSDVGRTDDEIFSRLKEQHALELSVSPLLARWAVADVAYGLTAVEGFQANPYRYVRLYAPGSPAHATAVAEHVPDQRFRHVATVRLRLRAARPLFAMVEQSFYADTWGVLAHAARARASLALGAFTVSVEGRGYRQLGASFYERRYETFPSAPTLRTADKELGPMWTARIGPHVDWTSPVPSGGSLRIGIGGDMLHMRYLDYEFLSSRTAWTVGADAALEL